jgi:hypothetical protein
MVAPRVQHQKEKREKNKNMLNSHRDYGEKGK